ncbi:MAG: glycerate kinase [Sporolactobacillus sp.]
MKIVIAPDSFKESLSAREAAEAIQQGWQTVFPTDSFALVPMADGGEGTVQALVDATGGHMIHRTVTGPLEAPVDAFFGLLGNGKTAVIEMAAAAGLEHIPPDRRNPLIATTYGVGELLRAAMDSGAPPQFNGGGGRAPTPGRPPRGEPLGFRFLDDAHRPLARGGLALSNLAAIDCTHADPRLAKMRIDIASDVVNPLLGEQGAAAVFAPQKGASAAQVQLLEAAMVRFAAVLKHDCGRDVAAVAGAGAAGGLGAGALCFLHARIRRGVDVVIEAARLEAQMDRAGLVMTGEGRIDGQTIFGKTPIGVARCAQKKGVPVIAFAGSLAPGYESVYAHGIDVLFPIVSGPVTLERALEEAAANLQRSARNAARLWQIAHP